MRSVRSAYSPSRQVPLRCNPTQPIHQACGQMESVCSHPDVRVFPTNKVHYRPEVFSCSPSSLRLARERCCSFQYSISKMIALELTRLYVTRTCLANLIHFGNFGDRYIPP